MSALSSNGSATGHVKTPALTAELLRFATAGSVDDGKSTLIGRLLHDSHAIMEDQLADVTAVSERRGLEDVDLALLTDGLRAEREQGITIDVAYRYFATLKRRFIIADTPGHEQYTRNMVTGASTADLAVVLVDARHGVVEQSRRHATVAGILGIPHLLVAVNKMDLVGWDETTFRDIVKEFAELAGRIGVPEVTFIPISALKGDNVVAPSESSPWYDGPTLLDHLETVHVGDAWNLDDARFPVQYVIRPQREEFHDYRGYAGQVASGRFRPGDEVVVLPSGKRSRITRIDTYAGSIDEASPPLSVTLLLEDDLDISRGDMIVSPARQPVVSREFEARVCWMADEPLRPRSRYVLRAATREVKVVIEEVRWRLDVNTHERDQDAGELGLNAIGRVALRASAPLAFDPYSHNRATGSFILIDEATNETVGAGMVREHDAPPVR